MERLKRSVPNVLTEALARQTGVRRLTVVSEVWDLHSVIITELLILGTIGIVRQCTHYL